MYVCMYVCVCVYVCMYVCMYVCTYMRDVVGTKIRLHTRIVGTVNIVGTEKLSPQRTFDHFL